MRRLISATLTIGTVLAFADLVSAEGLTKTGTCSVPSRPAQKQSLADSVQNSRYTVLNVSERDGRIVLRTATGALYEVSCQARVTTVTDDIGGLARMQAGDTVSLTYPNEIRILRRAWQETVGFER